MSSPDPFSDLNASTHNRIRSTLHCVGASFIVLMLTFIAQRSQLNLAATGFLQLLLVLLVSINAGFWEATFVATFAVTSLDFFLIPPLYTLRIDDPQNWLALGVFETSALVVSKLSAQIKKEASRALQRENELERIYRFSCDLLLIAPKGWPGADIAELIRQSFSCSAVYLFDSLAAASASVGTAGADLELTTRAAFLTATDPVGTHHTHIRNLLLAGVSTGVVGLEASGLSPVTASSIASLTAIALERVRSMQNESQSEAERRGEKLRTAILDALAHEYKTPLTAILTASSGLIEIGQLLPYQTELVSLIDSEASRLASLTSRLLHISRLDSNDTHGNPQVFDAADLVQTVLTAVNRPWQGHPVRLEGFESPFSIRADVEFSAIILSQLLENAAKYSPAASTITIGVQGFQADVHLHIHNFGPFIPPGEREKIFERFYRTVDAEIYREGTGIGLSICRKLAEACGGRVWLTSDPIDGNTFYLSLPSNSRPNELRDPPA